MGSAERKEEFRLDLEDWKELKKDFFTPSEPGSGFRAKMAVDSVQNCQVF